MKLVMQSIAGMVLGASTALACPDPGLWGERYSATGRDLYSPKYATVVAGGNSQLWTCRISAPNYAGRLPGYVARRPDFSINITRLSGYQLEVRTVGDCDTTLLVNTAAGNWYFDDDDNGNGQARMLLTRPSEGMYDFWVGTYDSNNCAASIILETH